MNADRLILVSLNAEQQGRPAFSHVMAVVDGGAARRRSVALRW